jgi:hypothetical protein
MRPLSRSVFCAVIAAAFLVFPAFPFHPEGTAEVRRLRFAGYDWLVKRSEVPTGPGGNRFSDSASSVFVDSGGSLHLRIRKSLGKWYSAELGLADSLGYGAYRFALDTALDPLDSNTVAGFFTWSNDPDFNHRELDVEFARWGNPRLEKNAQYVVQPPAGDSVHGFATAMTGDWSVHEIGWSRGWVSFDSRHGHPEGALPIASLPPMAGQGEEPAWIYRGDGVPPAGNEKFRINFYLFEGREPTDGKDAELVVSDFRFTPESR